MYVDIGVLPAANLSQVLHCTGSWRMALDGVSVQRC